MVIKIEHNNEQIDILSILWTNDYSIIKEYIETEYIEFKHSYYKNIFHAYVAYAAGVNNFEFNEFIANYLFQQLTAEEKEQNITALIFIKSNIPKDKFIQIVNYCFELNLPFDIKNQQGLSGIDYIKIGYSKYIKSINKKIIRELLK